jgi:glycosyltransferase involved in cell wall biosynthesis
MKIVFVLNTLGITGGVEVVFEHARQLKRRGHEVYVVHLLKLDEGFVGTGKAVLKKIEYGGQKVLGKPDISWFDLDGVKVLRVTNLEQIPDSDVVIATANETADWVAKLSKRKGKKFYFVQDYENWTREIDLVDRTYRLPLKKIVISSWLKELMKEKFNQEAELVGNGMDFEKFACPKKEFNTKKKILMLYHYLPKKGIKYGLEAVKMVQKEHPEIKLVLYGVYDMKDVLPENSEYHQRIYGKELADLYRSCDIFISPSLQEGCQMPPMEAMAAQCAVVATNVGGNSRLRNSRKNCNCNTSERQPIFSRRNFATGRK